MPHKRTRCSQHCPLSGSIWLLWRRDLEEALYLFTLFSELAKVIKIQYKQEVKLVDYTQYINRSDEVYSKLLTQRPHFLGNSVTLLHRDTLPRSTAEFDIGGGTRGHWGPMPPLMSREEAASYIGNAVAALK